MGVFRFKQFQIEHNHSFKVGTDGVLLGAWANTKGDSNVLEIGSGSGLISIMIAQRNSRANITGIEINKNSYAESLNNIKNSPWGNRIQMINNKLQDVALNEKYNHIVTNPPFFVNSTKSFSKQKNESRHTDSLNFETIISFTLKNLEKNGRLSIILPTEATFTFNQVITSKGFSNSRQTLVKSKADKVPERVLSEYTRSDNLICNKNELVIQYEGRHNYTPEYIKLTKEFYTIM